MNEPSGKNDLPADAPAPRTNKGGAKIFAFPSPNHSRKGNVLSDLKTGQSAILLSLDLPEAVQNHLMHMGFVPDARVVALRRAPAGDPTVYGVDGMEIALRRETASAIRMRPLESPLAVPLSASQNEKKNEGKNEAAR